MIQQIWWEDAAGGGGGEGRGGGEDKAPIEDPGGTPEGLGEGQLPRAVSGKARPSVFFNSATYAKRRGGGYRRRSVGGEPSDCVEACNAAAASALAPTVAALSLLFRDVLRLLRLGMVRTFRSEGGCRDVAGGVSPDSRMGILLSTEERWEVYLGPED